MADRIMDLFFTEGNGYRVHKSGRYLIKNEKENIIKTIIECGTPY